MLWITVHETEVMSLNKEQSDHATIESHLKSTVLIDNTCIDTKAIVPFLGNVCQNPKDTVPSEHLTTKPITFLFVPLNPKK